MGLLLKSLSRVDSLKPATASDPIEDAIHGAPIRQPPRSNALLSPTAIPLEFAASTVSVSVGHPDPATPRQIDTSTICLVVAADEPIAPCSDEPISLEALFAVPFPSETTDGVALARTESQTSAQTAAPDLATALDRLEQLQQTLAEDVAEQEAAPHNPSPNTPESRRPGARCRFADGRCAQ